MESGAVGGGRGGAQKTRGDETRAWPSRARPFLPSSLDVEPTSFPA
jgi:hypothetical protein